MSLFENATRRKYKFESAQGLITVEDLWDLDLKSKRGACLDDVAKAVNRQLKTVSEESFVDQPTKGNTELQEKLEIVKHIIATKQAENEAARQKADRSAQKARVLEILAKKQDDKLSNLSEEELSNLAKEL